MTQGTLPSSPASAPDARQSAGGWVVAGLALLAGGSAAVGGVAGAPLAVAPAAAVLVALLAALFCIGGVRAMALQTFAQCVRMRVAVAFMLILAAALAALPRIMTGDGTLPGAIRTLLAYGVSVIAFLLSLVTVLLATNVVAGDIQHKQVFLTATKPLARWQYVTGRWLGVVLLNALLLGLAMATVYVLSQHLRRQPEKISGEDRRVVETEVFAARGKVHPDPVDLQKRIQDRLETIRRQGRYQDAIEAWKSRTGGDAAKAEYALMEEIRKQVEGEQYSADPMRTMWWTFSGIRPAGGQIEFTGTVETVDARRGRLRVQVEPKVASRMLLQTPVHVQGVEVDGRVVETGEDFLVMQFFSEGNFQRLGPAAVPGHGIRATVDASIQITYKPTVTGNLPDDILTSTWLVSNPATGAQHLEGFRRDPANRPATLTVSSRVVDPSGKVKAEFFNQTLASVRIDPSDIYVLYSQGSFEWNYFRATVLMLLQLAFLAAVGVLAGSFLSFPVAVVVCLTLLLISLIRPFLIGAVQVSSIFAPGVDLLTAMGFLAMQLMTVLLPDFASTWPSDSLVGGLHISWTRLGQTASLTVGLRSMAALALCCLIFRRRELARVQV